jgi:hypothetical protein
MAAMRRGDFAAAWAISDAVLAARDPATRDDPRLPYHKRWVWDGRPYAGRHVLVRCYHGLGDAIQFARFLPLLRPHVRSLALEVPPHLLGLLAGLSGPDRLIPFRPEAPAAPAECDIELMELPHALRVSLEAARGRVPYLAPPAERVTAARTRIGAGFSVGLCWQAGDWDPERSVPHALQAPLVARPGLRLVSLQRGPAAAEASAVHAPSFANPHDRSLDLLDTAALIAALDLVITVDTMVAHLAGALGRPAWLLLKADADWRWMERRADSPWYPSIRLYRQTVPGNWHGPLEAMAADLARMSAAHVPAGRLTARTRASSA